MVGVMLLLVALVLLRFVGAQQGDAAACQIAGAATAHSVQEYAICLADRKDHEAAGDAFSRAAGIAAEPRDKAILLYNAGTSYQSAGSAGALPAQRAYARCLEVSGDRFRPCHIKVASLYRDLEDPERTMQHLRAAILLEPGRSDAYLYLADTLNNAKRFREAVDAYDEAIARGGPDPQPHLSRADALCNSKRYEEALGSFARARELSAPLSVQHTLALAGRLYASLELGRWAGLELAAAQLLAETRRYVLAPAVAGVPPSPLSPYRALFLDLPPAGNGSDLAKALSVRWLAGLQAATSGAPAVVSAGVASALPARPPQCQGLAIGYLSRRFHDYPGTQLLLRLFASHRRRRGACIFAFASGRDDGSAERATVARDSDLFVDLSSLSSAEGAAVLHSYRVDVLVDYDGLHEFNNQRLLSARPAPLEAVWLGFAGTSGGGLRRAPGSGLRYIIADRVVAPPEAADAFTEHLAYLPHSYQPQDEQQLGMRSGERAPADVRRRERLRLLSLHSAHRDPKDGVSDQRAAGSSWLVSFNRQSKIQPEVVSDWALILSRRPDTVLVLMAESPEVARQMKAHLAAVGSGRVLFFARMPRADYRALLSACDLFLDVRPYGAHTVASDALFFGVPVATLQAGAFAARVAASLNSAAGLEVFTAFSRKGYVDVVVALLGPRGLLPAAAAGSRSGCLFNSPAVARHLEALYSSMATVKGAARGLGMHIWMQEPPCE